MAKNNKKTKNPDPMSNVKTMGKEGMKIIRNIAHGTYNIYAEGHIFRNPEFVKAIIVEVDKRLIEHAIHVRAIEFAYANTQDANVLSLLHRDRKAYEAYSIIRQTLESIAITGDTGFLWVLSNKLPQYKYNI